MPGRQFANDVATPDPIAVSRDQYQDEIPTDRPSHENTTPGLSASMYTGRHYSDDFMGGYENYGVSVGSKGASKETITVNPNSADRGKES
jgi:hypothetical protein